jgi:hypothetical protein
MYYGIIAGLYLEMNNTRTVLMLGMIRVKVNHEKLLQE